MRRHVSPLALTTSSDSLVHAARPPCPRNLRRKGSRNSEVSTTFPNWAVHLMTEGRIGHVGQRSSWPVGRREQCLQAGDRPPRFCELAVFLMWQILKIIDRCRLAISQRQGLQFSPAHLDNCQVELGRIEFLEGLDKRVNIAQLAPAFDLNTAIGFNAVLRPASRAMASRRRRCAFPACGHDPRIIGSRPDFRAVKADSRNDRCSVRGGKVVVIDRLHCAESICANCDQEAGQDFS